MQLPSSEFVAVPVYSDRVRDQLDLGFSHGLMLKGGTP